MNNIVYSESEVANVACQLTAPENITVSADAGQAGAVVTYTTPTGTGDCGTATSGENGETFRRLAVIHRQARSSRLEPRRFYVLARTGPTVSFQVTVDNPGALTISLNGAIR